MKYLKNSSYLANIDRSYSFLIFKDDDKDLVGGINIFNVRRGASQSSSIGYWIGKRHSRKGYMYEALKILLPSLFIDLRLHRIEAAVLKHNKPSRKLLEKIGFIQMRYLNISFIINKYHQMILLYIEGGMKY